MKKRTFESSCRRQVLRSTRSIRFATCFQFRDGVVFASEFEYTVVHLN